MVHAQRGRGEEGEQVEVLTTVAGVDQPRTVRPVEVQHEIEPVDEQVPGQAGVDVRRGGGALDSDGHRRIVRQ